MPLPISSVIIDEKNKLASDGVWLLALEVNIPGVNDPVRVVRNNENIVWRGEPWVAFRFEIDEISEKSKAEVPRVDLRVSNINQVFESYVQDWDTWTKQNGFSPITVNIYLLNSKDLANDDPVADYLFDLKQPRMSEKWATFTLGAKSPFNRRFPQGQVRKNYCRYKFKIDPRCGYTGTVTTCNRTLPYCRYLENSHRFGGQVGAGNSSLQIAQL
jgi:phage-related protein